MMTRFRIWTVEIHNRYFQPILVLSNCQITIHKRSCSILLWFFCLHDGIFELLVSETAVLILIRLLHPSWHLQPVVNPHNHHQPSLQREIARIRVAGKKRKSIPTKKGCTKAERKLQRQAGEKEKKILQNFPGFCAIASSFRWLLISRMDCLNSSRFTFPSWSTSVSFSQEFTYKWKSGQWTGKALFKMVLLWPMVIFINMQSTHTVNKRFKCSLIPYTIQGGRR